jgi:hypothetical protein
LLTANSTRVWYPLINSKRRCRAVIFHQPFSVSVPAAASMIRRHAAVWEASCVLFLAVDHDMEMD